MAMDELLPPACAFALSVLAESSLDPDSVPEEAVEAAKQHRNTCLRCLSDEDFQEFPQPARSSNTATRRKKKTRRPVETSSVSQPLSSTPAPDNGENPVQGNVGVLNGTSEAAAPVHQSTFRSQDHPTSQADTLAAPLSPAPQKPSSQLTPPVATEQPESPLDCLQCRQLLPEYTEAMDSGQNVALLYPEVQEHLLNCETGCLVLLDLFRQDAKANRKLRRRPVHNPFSVIYWEITGFFRGGLVSISPRALAYGTLLFFICVASFSAYLGILWDNARYYHPAIKQIPTPNGIGLSDGLNIYDACNVASYQDKREAAQAMQRGNLSRAGTLLASATSVVANDTTGCNGAEAAIYAEDLHVRQSGHPFGIIVVGFDSGPGNADPTGGTDRHILYAAYTQELVGAYIGQQQYNATQMQTPGAPLLYLVLANTTGIEQGALQIANSISTLAATSDPHQFGLLANGKVTLLAVLGMGPSSLVQVVLPALCRAGLPLIVPTATGLFIVDILSQTSMYRHCTPGFAVVRFSPDDARQSELGANFAYNQLHVRNAAIYYDPSNPSSSGSAFAFSNSFSQRSHAHIVARETAVASGLLDDNGLPQASRKDLLAGLHDALLAHPELIFAPLLTNDVITLAQAVAQLPQNQQPILMIGGEFVRPTALQGLVQWARQQQLSLPRVFVSLSAVARPPTNSVWQKQFYATFCTSFATPGSYCSGAAALDQGALFFGDGVKIVANAVGPTTASGSFPTSAQLVQNISREKFDGVSCPIALRLWDNVLVTSIRVLPVVVGVQADGSLQVVG